MQIEVDLKRNNCHYEQCRHYEDGMCLNDKARRDCLDIALAVLCIEDKFDVEREIGTDNN